jgi:hypothetical protein
MLWFFSSPWTIKFCAGDFWLCEPLNFLVLALCIYFAVTGRDIPFLITLALGAAVKESALFAFPLHYTFNARRPLDFRQLRRTALVSLPAVAVLIGIRLAIPALNDYGPYIATLTGPLAAVKPTLISYHYYPMFLDHGLPWFTHPSTDDLQLLTLKTFGLLVILPLFALRRNLPLLLRFSPHIALCLFQVCLIDKSNTERLVVLAIPEMILMSLLGLHALSHRQRISPWAILPLPWLGLALHLERDPRNLYPAAPVYRQVMLLVLYLAAAAQLPYLWRLARRLSGQTNADAGDLAARVPQVCSS